MGGLSSGRKRQHTCIDDCLEIDLAWFRRQKLLQPVTACTISWKKWREIDFQPYKRTEYMYKVGALVHLRGDSPTLTLTYQTQQSDNYGQTKELTHTPTINLTSTPCHYGGQRWWMIAPCCQRRVRVLYINLKADMINMTPQCRNCQDLHYASQCSSYVARHITYEKYLLANYGYYWAADQYQSMKQHYFHITDEYYFKMERSQLQRHLELMKLFISCERLILKSRMRTLKALSVEGRREYFADLAADPEKAEDLAEYQHLEAIMIMRGIIPAADSGDQVSEPAPESEVSEILSLQLARCIMEETETAEALAELCEEMAA